jgi:hypothetical protein
VSSILFSILVAHSKPLFSALQFWTSPLLFVVGTKMISTWLVVLVIAVLFSTSGLVAEKAHLLD